MDYERACLELQAGLLATDRLPVLACEAIAAGREGVTLRGLAALIGEPADLVRKWAESVPSLDENLESELGLPRRTRDEGLWELVRFVARSVIAGEQPPNRGAGQLVVLAGRVNDERLWHETARLEGILEQWHYEPARHRMSEEIVRECQRLSELGDVPGQ